MTGQGTGLGGFLFKNGSEARVRREMARRTVPCYTCAGAAMPVLMANGTSTMRRFPS